MWHWKLDWGEVRDDLVIGSCPMTPADVPAIKRGTNATALLSLQTDECRAAFDIDLEAIGAACAEHGMVLANVPMRDFDPPEQRCKLPAAVTELTLMLAGGHRVYVHCTAGINRSPLTVLSYLTYVEGLDREEALRLILQTRPDAEPYWEAYDGAWADLVDRSREEISFHAHLLSQREPDAAPEDHWFRAEREVVRNRFVAAAADRRQRRDPHRA